MASGRLRPTCCSKRVLGSVANATRAEIATVPLLVAAPALHPVPPLSWGRPGHDDNHDKFARAVRALLGVSAVAVRGRY